MVLLRRFLLVLVALLTMSSPTLFAQDTLVNLVQWPSSAGGNNHWYAVIALTRPWVTHDSLARTLVHDGVTGYLASITSPEENQFIVDHVIIGLHPDAVYDQYYLGGLRTGGTFRWLTGEPMTYMNWDSGEPSGDGPAMGIWGWAFGDASAEELRLKGKWNDVPKDTLGIGPIHQLWSVVEWGGPVIPEPSHDSLLNLIQWPASEGGNGHWYAVVGLTKPWVDHRALAGSFVHDGLHAHLASVTSAAENQFIVDWVIRGLRAAAVYDEYYLGGLKTGGTWTWLTGEPMTITNFDDYEPSGDGPALAMWGWDYGASVTMAETRHLGKWNDVPDDTTGRGPLHQLWSIIEWDSDAIITCGDANNDGQVNADDLDFLLTYYFMYGPPPPISLAADVNGSGDLDIGDIVALAAYLNGQLPSPCSTRWLFDDSGGKRGGPTGLEEGTSGN